MAGKFVLKKGSGGGYHFNLVATNGQVIATSETYERKQSALNGIESVKTNAPGAKQTTRPASSARPHGVTCWRAGRPGPEWQCRHPARRRDPPGELSWRRWQQPP